MKTLVGKTSNVSLYVFEDTETVQITESRIIVGSPEKLIIADHNSSSAALCENVTVPADWVGGKYLYTQNDGWALNSEWTEPEPEPS